MQIKQPQINLENVRFPRELEVDNTAQIVRRTLLADMVLLRPESNLVIPRIEMNMPVKIALQRARLQRRICCGFDDISGMLENEKAGIANACSRSNIPYGSRISRLLLFSNDGAPRLYRHIEQLLIIHAPRLLGCLLNISCEALGYLINDRESQVKIIMIENKAAVCNVLRAMTAKPDAG